MSDQRPVNIPSNKSAMQLLVACLGLLVSDVLAGPHEDRIIRNIFIDNFYHVSSRPVSVESNAIEVKFGISLQQIIDVDEKNEMLHTNMWLNYEWKDYKLSWNESEYGGVKSIRLPSASIWTPDILLYNSADEDIDSKFPTNIVVSSDGTCSWIPLGLYISSCGIDITWFPFDDQICTMKFGSWTYDGSKINLTSRDETIDLSTYQPSGEWNLIAAPAKQNVQFYDCCPEPYIDITFTIHIRRRTLYHGFNLIIPCAMISFLTLLTFVLPPDEGEKIGLGITILLSLTVFQMIVADTVPATSMAVPLIGVYFSTVMFMCTLSVITTVVVLNFHHRNPDMYEMPNWVRVLVCEWLAWLLRMNRPGKDNDLESLLRRRRVRRLEAAVPPSASLISNVKDIDNTIPLMPPGSPYRSTNGSVPNAADSATNNNTVPCGAHMPASFLSYSQDLGGDPSSAQTESQVVASTMASLRAELLAILNELRWMTAKMKDDAEAGEQTNEWKFVAMVVDRLCFWVFTIWLVVATLVIFFRAPNVFVS